MQERFCPVCKKPIDNKRRYYCSDACKMRSYRLRLKGDRSKSANGKGIVYLLESGGLHKIGKTVDLAGRLAFVRSLSPCPVTILHNVITPQPSELETRLHELFADRRKHGEWFLLTPDDIKQCIAEMGQV